MRTFRTIAEIQEATEDGSFDENHYLEAKTLLKTKSNSDKDELARDLAQFAFDGGTVVFGVREYKSDPENQFAVAPFELPTNVREKIEQIAQERCQPALAVRVREVRSEQDAQEGCLVVEVPPSTRVPHMVAGKYPFRGDSTRRHLNDAEVRMWIARSEDVHERVDRELCELVARDPFVGGSRRAGHLFGLALPLTSRHDDLPEQRELHPLVREAATAFGVHWRDRFGRNDRRSRQHGESTALSTVTFTHPRSGEYALRTSALTELESGSGDGPKEENLAEWSVDTSGAIRIYDAGLSTHRMTPRNEEANLVWLDTPVELLGILVESARLYGEQISYHGQWGFGIAWTGLRGARLHTPDLFRSTPVIDRDEGTYQDVINAYELSETPGDVLIRMARPMMRMLGDEDYLYPAGQ